MLWCGPSDMSEAKMRIAARFNGPPDSGHGGVACGVFAGALDGRAASVRLLSPPPLETEFELRVSDTEVIVATGGQKVAQVRALPEGFEVMALPLLSSAELQEAHRDWIERVVQRHAFPTCFGCGPSRPDRDGLEQFAGYVDGPDVCGIEWTPDASLQGSEGAVADWVVWAAVDCPSGGAVFRLVPDGMAMVLGELAVRIDELPAVGTTYQIVAKASGREGRRCAARFRWPPARHRPRDVDRGARPVRSVTAPRRPSGSIRRGRLPADHQPDAPANSHASTSPERFGLTQRPCGGVHLDSVGHAARAWSGRQSARCEVLDGSRFRRNLSDHCGYLTRLVSEAGGGSG